MKHSIIQRFIVTKKYYYIFANEGISPMRGHKTPKFYSDRSNPENGMKGNFGWVQTMSC